MCWRCLTLPQPHDCSTISAVKLSYRDRNGTGRTLDAKTTNTNLIQTTPIGCVVSNTVQQTQTRYYSSCFAATTCSWRNQLLISYCPHTGCFLCRCISTSHLTTRHHAHSPGLSTPSSSGNLNRNLILKQASRLDAFSGYPSRT